MHTLILQIICLILPFLIKITNSHYSTKYFNDFASFFKSIQSHSDSCRTVLFLYLGSSYSLKNTDTISTIVKASTKYPFTIQIQDFNNVTLSLDQINFGSVPQARCSFLDIAPTTLQIRNSKLNELPKDLNVTKLRLHPWLSQCSPFCWHFTLLHFQPEVNLLNKIFTSISLRSGSPRVRHFVFSNYSKQYVCSSSALNPIAILIPSEWMNSESLSNLNHMCKLNHPKNIFTVLLRTPFFPDSWYRGRGNIAVTFMVGHGLPVHVARALNATPTNFKKSYGYGVQHLNGTWDGYTSDLIEDRGEMTEILMVSYNKRHIMTYSTIINFNRVIFVTFKSKRVTFSFDFLLKPLSTGVWMSLGITSVITAVTMLVYSRVVSMMCNTRENDKQSAAWIIGKIVTVFSVLGQTLVDQSVMLQLKIMRSGRSNAEQELFFGMRIMIGFWLFSIMTLNSIYKTRMVSILVNPEMSSPPNTFEDLLKSPFRIYGDIINFGGGGGIADLKFVDSEVTRRLVARMKQTNVVKCLDALKEPMNACFGRDDMLKMMASQMEILMDEYKRPLYQMSKSSVLPTFSAYGLQKNSPIKDVVDFVGGVFLQAAIPSYWGKIIDIEKNSLAKKLPSSFFQMGGDSNFTKYQVSTFETISAEGISYSLILLVILETIAALIFIWECCRSYYYYKSTLVKNLDLSYTFKK